MNNSINTNQMIIKACDDTPKSENALKCLRIREGFTQVEFGKLFGIPQSSYSQMENGNRPISEYVARKIAKRFKIDYRSLL